MRNSEGDSKTAARTGVSWPADGTGTLNCSEIAKCQFRSDHKTPDAGTGNTAK
jgi:hypothetical protein